MMDCKICGKKADKICVKCSKTICDDCTYNHNCFIAEQEKVYGRVFKDVDPEI